MKQTLSLIIGSLLCSTAFAGDCGGKFSETGAFLLGKTFKLEVEVPNSPVAAFNGAYRTAVKEGWKIEQSDRELGVISAVHGEQALRGKRLPLNITIEPASGGSEITLQFATPPGLGSSESDVREGFCKIVAGASKTMTPADTGSPAHGATLISSSTAAIPTPASAASPAQPSAPLAYADTRVKKESAAGKSSDFNLKWTQQVSETIEVLDVTVNRPSVVRFVKMTYQPLKACGTLGISGTSFSKDGVNLGPIFFKALNVRPGQKYREEFAAPYEANHYVVLEKAYCEKW